MSEEGERLKADYNSAQHAIDRVNVIKRDLHLAKITKNFEVWCDLLFNYLSEVNPQMSREEEKEYKESLRDVRARINRPTRGLRDANKGQIYDDLYDVELELERFYDSMGNKYRYQEKQREVSLDDSELADLREYGGGGGDWSRMNNN